MDIQAKYRKVKILAERGATEGERAAALAAVERMEQAYPELKPGTSDRALKTGKVLNVSMWTHDQGWVNISSAAGPMEYTSTTFTHDFDFDRYWT